MSTQEFNNNKEWATCGTVAVSERNDKLINIPNKKGCTFFFTIHNDPHDVTNELITIKANEGNKHIEIIFNYKKFLEAMQQARLRSN